MNRHHEFRQAFALPHAPLRRAAFRDSFCLEVGDLDINTMAEIGMPGAGLVLQVKALLSEELGLPPDIGDSEGIFSGGYLQSIDVVTIILLLREKFAVVVRPDEVNLRNFDSIALISNFIERERNRPAASATIH